MGFTLKYILLHNLVSKLAISDITFKDKIGSNLQVNMMPKIIHGFTLT